jgi:hypothetical protein
MLSFGMILPSAGRLSSNSSGTQWTSAFAGAVDHRRRPFSASYPARKRRESGYAKPHGGAQDHKKPGTIWCQIGLLSLSTGKLPHFAGNWHFS